MIPSMKERAANLLFEWARMQIWIERLDKVGGLSGCAMLVEHHDAHRYQHGFEWVGLTRGMGANCLKGMWRGALVDRSADIRDHLESYFNIKPEQFSEAAREVRFAMESHEDHVAAERAIDREGGFA